MIELGKQVDTLIIIPNNRLLSVLERETTMVDAFRVADDVCGRAYRISDLVTLLGLINLDFADGTIMTDAGQALLGSAWRPVSAGRSRQRSRPCRRRCWRRRRGRAFDPPLDYRRP